MLTGIGQWDGCTGRVDTEKRQEVLTLRPVFQEFEYYMKVRRRLLAL